MVHAHGGPSLGPTSTKRNDEDIRRWAITAGEDHARAGSVFRQGGFAVTTAAEDTARVRRIFVNPVAKPRRTLLHGQSWGGMVATRAAELFPKSWDGMLLTSAVVAGPATDDFRVDLRAIYQSLCGNHPRPDEPAYPLPIGLPADSRLTHADVAQRVDDCLGTGKPAAQRTPARPGPPAPDHRHGAEGSRELGRRSHQPRQLDAGLTRPAALSAALHDSRRHVVARGLRLGGRRLQTGTCSTAQPGPSCAAPGPRPCRPATIPLCPMPACHSC